MKKLGFWRTVLIVGVMCSLLGSTCGKEETGTKGKPPIVKKIVLSPAKIAPGDQVVFAIDLKQRLVGLDLRTGTADIYAVRIAGDGSVAPGWTELELVETLTWPPSPPLPAPAP